MSNNLQTSACYTRDKLVVFYLIIISLLPIVIHCTMLVHMSLTIIYTTFTPHFKGKRRYINDIQHCHSLLWNAIMRNGGSIYKIYSSQEGYICIYYLHFSLMHFRLSQISLMNPWHPLSYIIVTLHGINCGLQFIE